ncbi:MAG TPA: hybrid sensor histidine kinase/response regulator [Dissulfurispiraceae bacterium]
MNGKHSGSILVVDDDPYVLDSVSLFLSASGFQVTSAGDAEDAMTKYRGSKVDAVLTDVKMPLVSGIDLLEKIHAADPELPVILMTAYADLDIAIDAIKKGAFDFIIKPYKPEQLIHSVEKAVKYRGLIQLEKDYRHMLEEFNKEMETLVAERTMSLMALTIADRVRNPAATIGWTCKRLLEREHVPAAVKEGLEGIMTEATKLETIVKDFHDLLRGRKSMFRYEDLNRIMEDIMPVIRREAEGKGVDIVTRFTDGELKINAQKNLLEIAIFHLVRNALEATPEGGRIVIETSGDHRNVALTITDTGPGIPREDLDRIFDPFFSTKAQRFGMGLPLVKQVISEHIGDIRVESEKGTGTTFRITFPARWIEKALR